MADKIDVKSASALIDTGKGILAGIIVSCSSATPATVTLYDNTAGSGTKILEVHVASPNPVIIFFSDRFAPIYATGLYLTLAANLTATVWTRQV